MKCWVYLQAEGENVDKLEKADILEFTVKHLQKITRRDPVEEAYKFQVSFKIIICICHLMYQVYYYGSLSFDDISTSIIQITNYIKAKVTFICHQA